MKLFLFVALICISLQHVSLQKQEDDDDFEEQIRAVRVQMGLIFKHLNRSNEDTKELKEVFFRLLSKREKETLPCFKETYLSQRGQNDMKLLEISQVSILHNQLNHNHKNISSQAQEDIVECFLNFKNNAIRSTIISTLMQLKKWGTKNWKLNATYVEQKLNDELWQMNYGFFREDFNECLELFEMDLSKKLAPEAVSRIISLVRMMYGNRTEIETALSYLYGSAVGSTKRILVNSSVHSIP